MIRHGGNGAIWADLRDSTGKPARIRPDRSWDLRASALRRGRTACSSFGDVKIAIGAELQAARVIESTREDAHIRRWSLCRKNGWPRKHQQQCGAQNCRKNLSFHFFFLAIRFVGFESIRAATDRDWGWGHETAEATRTQFSSALFRLLFGSMSN